MTRYYHVWLAENENETLTSEQITEITAGEYKRLYIGINAIDATYVKTEGLNPKGKWYVYNGAEVYYAIGKVTE